MNRTIKTSYEHHLWLDENDTSKGGILLEVITGDFTGFEGLKLYLPDNSTVVRFTFDELITLAQAKLAKDTPVITDDTCPSCAATPCACGTGHMADVGDGAKGVAG